MSDDLVYLYRGNINRFGKYVLRENLPAGAERLAIRHTMSDVGSVDPAGPIPDPRIVDAFLVRE